jgi:sorting nexin-25
MVDSKDSIAEPIYVLIENLFDLKGIKWFRKSLIAFVQFTYDGTINRKIREAIYSLLNEEMLAVYLKQLRDGFWSFNKTSQQYELIQANVESTQWKADEDKIKLRNSVKLKLIDNIPGYMDFYCEQKTVSVLNQTYPTCLKAIIE